MKLLMINPSKTQFVLDGLFQMLEKFHDLLINDGIWGFLV